MPRFTTIIATALGISAAHAQAAACVSLDDLTWLLGNWTTSTKQHTTQEAWKRISEETFEGTGKTLARDSTTLVAKEALRLVKMNAGIYYIAKVSHNPLPVAFTLVECSDTHAVFENVNHDFPNRIGYRLIDKKKLEVSVTGGGTGGFELLFSKD